MRILLTGATGLLGSNFLLEWVKNYLGRLDDLEVLILGRQKGDKALERRIYELVAGGDGLAYLGASVRKKDVEGFLKKNVRCVNCDLGLPSIGISSTELTVLRGRPIDFFFHIASTTDFRSTPMVDKALESVIVEGTRKIIALLDSCEVKEFVYVGTAYSCGNKSGVLQANEIDFNVVFRNPYEKRKLEAEVLVREYCKKRGLKYRVFRPSTISGRLIEDPVGATTKFDVFYSWAIWFLREKLKSGIRPQDLFNTVVDVPIRICCRDDSGLNIVPADFAAKVMYQVCAQNIPGDSFYLVNEGETPHREYVSWMIDFVNVSGASTVGSVPSDPSKLERVYYKTVGSVFTPYVTNGPMLFCTENLSMLRDGGLRCPKINRERFTSLLLSIKKIDLGLKTE